MALPLLFATQNAHKAREVETLLQGIMQVASLVGTGITEELPETGNTLEANAQEKAAYVFTQLHRACFAEDTGLEIDALNGAPGVYTARYAGPERDNLANMNKVLHELKSSTNRKAQFRTVIALHTSDGVHLFEGIVKGSIAHSISGKGGFGYDPIFIPEGHDKTFAELGDDIKNTISHRARAIEKLKAFLAVGRSSL